jgi:hypothetical protein
MTTSTVASHQQPHYPKLGFKRENFVLRFSAVKYLQKLGEEIHSVPSTSC